MRTAWGQHLPIYPAKYFQHHLFTGIAKALACFLPPCRTDNLYANKLTKLAVAEFFLTPFAEGTICPVASN